MQFHTVSLKAIGYYHQLTKLNPDRKPSRPFMYGRKHSGIMTCADINTSIHPLYIVYDGLILCTYILYPGSTVNEDRFPREVAILIDGIQYFNEERERLLDEIEALKAQLRMTRDVVDISL